MTEQYENFIKTGVIPERYKTLARRKGWIELSAGVYLETAGQIKREQQDWDDSDECKHFDFSGAPLWVITAEADPIPVEE